MKIERGLEHKCVRLRLVIHSEDIYSHSAMSDNAPAFETMADDTRDWAQAAMNAVVDAIPAPKPEVKPAAKHVFNSLGVCTYHPHCVVEAPAEANDASRL